ncbi:penicillin-binding protein 2 [Candidatus Dormiibacter inghamiae]|uniref:peptidoglycan D,D-transpeptidase FtsI family protein n=1 Tax=Candidatus Dormiibacter inghamiae TaxID=3127013 RepID=UPI001A27D3F8|nr:penicillin-binding protein 2 [Candidatus Dormibacteraeota bacterium]
MAVSDFPAGQRRVGSLPRPGLSGSKRQEPGGQLPRLRVLWLLVVAILLAVTIWGRLAYWQVVQHNDLGQLAGDQYLHSIPLPASRGLLLDRELRPLAVNSTVYDVTIAPSQIDVADRDRVGGVLSLVLGADPQVLTMLLASGKQFAYVARRQPKEKVDQLRAARLPGVDLQAVEQRQYLPGGVPNSTLASQLLGFVDWNGRGQRGVEQAYQTQLAGRPGHESSYTDLYGRQIVLGPDSRVPAENGAPLVLTVDANIQYAAEQAIAQGVQEAKAESGSVIVMDTQTGGIVAWASAPGYDANQFASQDPNRLRDPIGAQVYEPGSIMKVVTLAGAIDNGSITPETTINDPGYINVGGVTLHDYDLANHGTITMTNVLERSLNVGAVRAEQAMGKDAYLRNLKAFGIGQPSGVDVAGESASPLRQQWRDAEVATASYGQGVAVNMVQMCAALNAVSNGGVYVQPHVVQSQDGRPVPIAAPRQVISAQSAATMRMMMRSVVQHGAGHLARIPGFELDEGGKTGTSNIPENGKYSKDVWASYAGFLPADNPRFTMLVVVKHPNNGSDDHNEGYYVSAPIWKAIAQEMILQWRIAPENLQPV